MLKTFESPFGFFHLQVDYGLIAKACFEDFPFLSSLDSLKVAKSFMNNVFACCSSDSICPNGSVFQKKTWDCLALIKPGHSRSYTEIAKKWGRLKRLDTFLL